MLKVQDYNEYIKCGIILKSPLTNAQRPYILKCIDCDEINFILESFVIHMQEHCRKVADQNGNNDARITNENELQDENIEKSIDKVDTVAMENDDPLIVIKYEMHKEVKKEEAGTNGNNREDSKQLEEDNLWNSYDEIQTDDVDTDDDEVASKHTKKKRKSSLSPSVEKFIKSKQNMKTLIELYKNQPNLWNKDLPFYRFRDKRQTFLEEITQVLNNELKSNYTWKEVSDIISYIYRKHQNDFKRLRFYEEEDKDSKDMKYKCCWFFDDLYFLRPNPVVQLQKLDPNLPDLTTEQVFEIIQIYKEFPYLWDTNLIEYICSNKRQEAQVEMLKKIEMHMNINTNEKALEEYLRSMHYYFSREKRLRKNNIANKSINHAEDYYEQLLYLYDHEGPFNCPDCSRVFTKPLGYKVHKSNHDNSIPFVCSQCNKEFKTIPSFTVHVKRHFADLDFACNVCNRKFITYKDLRIHLLIHSGDRPYCCEICGTSFRHIQCFKKHQRRHEKRYTHICIICSKGYYTKAAYDDHMNSHMNIRSYICQLCGKAFITLKALKTHSVTHEDARNHACKLCGKTFKLKISVLQHMRTHGSRVENGDKN